MSRRAAIFLIGGIVAAAALLFWVSRERREPGDEAALRPDADRRGDSRTVTLYFPAPGERLVGEPREVRAGDDAELAAAILTELLAGPRSDDLYAPLPAGIEVGGVHLGRTGVAYVDLRTAEGASRPQFGSQQEILAAYSVVNSVCENLPDVVGVVLLWNGSQSSTFTGNLDTRRPLAPDRALLAGAA